MRVKPRPTLVSIVGIGSVIRFLVLEKTMGVGYDVIGSTTDNIIRGIVLPLAVGTVALVLTIVGATRIFSSEAGAQAA